MKNGVFFGIRINDLFNRWLSGVLFIPVGGEEVVDSIRGIYNRGTFILHRVFSGKQKEFKFKGVDLIFIKVRIKRDKFQLYKRNKF